MLFLCYITQALEFQNLYQAALQNISMWLDEVEVRLFSPPGDEDTDRHIAESRSVIQSIFSAKILVNLKNELHTQNLNTVIFRLKFTPGLVSTLHRFHWLLLSSYLQESKYLSVFHFKIFHFNICVGKRPLPASFLTIQW